MQARVVRLEMARKPSFEPGGELVAPHLRGFLELVHEVANFVE